ncbi:plasmid recombination protein [Lachnospiraceae bacterium SGI.085]
MKDIKNSGNGEKQFYEIVVQIGKKDDTGVLDSEGNLSVDAKAASEILDEYARSFQERNPNLYLFNAVLHMDEATPHLHLDYIPVAHGYKTKMHTRNSLTKALQEMGIAPAVSKTDNETTHWQEREREYLKGLCLERGIEVEILGVKRDNYTIPEYKVAMRATEELTAELEILNAEKQEAESVIASVGAEIADAREEVEESKKHLDEINEQIADREKRYAVYEKKIDKVLAAGKPVAKELAVIRKNAKQLPSILGSEPSVKISEKDFNRLIDMAQASGTLEKLNEIYDRELEHMQGIIDDLMVQVKTWKDKVLQYDKFIRTLEKQDGITCEFDAGIWSSFVQEVVAKAKDDIRFIFKNGFEVRV